MITADQIHERAQSLDPLRLQELSDFLEFLLAKRPPSQRKEDVFPPTQLESSDAHSVYQGRALSLEEMDQAVEFEAGRQR